MNWQKKLVEQTREIKNSNQLVPLISGSASIILLNRIIFSNLEGNKFYWSLVVICLMFIASIILYYYLRKLEKEKDVYLLSVVGRTVGDVFKRYGQQLAKSNADRASAKDMNEIMKTIVDLVKNMNLLGNKQYVGK